MSRTRQTRRELLRRMGVGAAAIPLVSFERRHDAHAATGYPKRFVVIAGEGGHTYPIFWPQGTSERLADLTFPSNLEPLAPFKEDLLLVGPLANTTSRGGHEFRNNMLIGRRYTTADDSLTLRPGGISLDQHLANEYAKTAALPVHSLCLAAHISTGSSIDSTTINAAARDRFIPLENNPQKVFDLLFKGRDLGTDKLAALRAMKKSVLDRVKGDLQRFATVMGAEDRRKVEAHLESVRGLEMQVSAAPGVGCVPPVLPKFDFSRDAYVGSAATAVEINRQIPALMKAMMDLMVTALACDVTRVATLVLGKSGGFGQISPAWPGMPKEVFPNGESYRGHHQDLAHANWNTRPYQLVQRWQIEQVTYIIDRLKKTPEPGGRAGETLLDNTLFLYTNPMSNPAGHFAHTLPWFMAGRAGGRIRPGRFVRLGDWKQGMRENPAQVDHNCLLLTIANAMLDRPLTTWGDLALPLYKDDPSRPRSPGTSVPDPRYRGELPELYA